MRNKNNNKGFGVLFFIVFLIISLWPLLDGNNLRIWSLLISLIFLILGFLNSKFLNPLKRIWIKFGEILGRVIAPIVLFFIYFVVLTPISFLLKIFGKDLLRIKLSDKKSYWIKRDEDLGSMRNQF
jgi:CBS domain containing-hemolysin-like protein